MNDIHPTAIISPGAKIGEGVHIGAYSYIGDHCELGDDCWIDTHVKIADYTTLGKRCRVYFGALVGEEPQDHRFKPGTVAYTKIGDDVTLREYVTIHRSPFPGGETVVGDRTLLMAFVHAGHDVRIGKSVTVANHTAISGHVIIEDGAVLSGYVLIHQFCRIGALAMVGGRTIVIQDIPPFCMLTENNCICGANTIGLRRAQFPAVLRMSLRKAIKLFFFHGLNSTNALSEIEKQLPASPELNHFIEFIRKTERGIMPGDPELKLIGMNQHTETEEEA